MVRKTLVGCLFTVAIFQSVMAAADPVQLISFQTRMEDEPGAIAVDTADFRVFFARSGSAFVFFPHEQCYTGFCQAGTTFDVGFQSILPQISSTFLGNNTFNGILYPELTVDGSLVVSGAEGVAPTVPVGTAPRTTHPVTLSGFLTIYPDASRSAPLASAELFGVGSVEIIWQRRAGNDLGVQPRVEAYQFGAAVDPVPEPGTLLLVGSGILGLVRKLHGYRSGNS